MSTTTSGLVSVVVPCYNAEPFVAETIESALAQSYPAVEVIVVDDHSTDGSWEVVQRYAERVTAVRLPENRKGSHARNRGAERARGEFLMFLDADDVISPDAVRALVEAVRDRPGGIAFCEWRRLVKSDGRWQKEPADIPLPRAGDDHLAGWLEGIWVPPCAVLWRRDVYEATGGWDETLTGDDDADLMMRALAGGASLVNASGGEAYYRAHDPSRVSVSTNLASSGNLKSRIRVLEKITEQLEAMGRLDAYKKSIGIGYYRLVPLCWLNHPEAAEECKRRGERLAGRQAVSGTRLGKVVSWLFGVGGKERIISALARVGIMSAERRRIARIQKSKAGDGSPAKGAS